MNDFLSTCADHLVLDPYKRVHYTNGLVLGVDEFLQEQTYFLEKNCLHNRALHGYGTICGLEVKIEDADNGPEVRVEPGLAVNPKGQEIRVTIAQCARLNDWLERHSDLVSPAFGSPPEPLTLYLVLCYRECQTDRVPIPGGPCRSLEDNSAPSRIADDFELDLRREPPDEIPAQVEEDAIRKFGELLRRMEISDQPGEFLTLEQLEQLVRDLALTGSPPESPGFFTGSPPSDSLRIPADEAAEMLRAAFRVWVTEVRPHLLPDGKNCASGPPNEGCVLLAEIEFDVQNVGARLEVVGGADSVTVNEERRPYLLQTRLLQEWLLTSAHWTGTQIETKSFVTLFMLNPRTLRLWIQHPDLLDVPLSAVDVVVLEVPPASPVATSPGLLSIQPFAGVNVFDLDLDMPLENGSAVELRLHSGSITVLSSGRVLAELLAELEHAYLDQDGETLLGYLGIERPALGDLSDVNVTGSPPPEGHVLTFRSGVWVPEPATKGTGDHGQLTGLEDDDHPQYLRADGTRPLTGNWDAGGFVIRNVQNSNAPDAVVRVDRAVKIGDAAGGDLSGTYPDPIVAGLQKNPISNAQPNPNDVLTWNGNEWVPSQQQAQSQIQRALPFVTIDRVNTNIFDVWFNVDAPNNLVKIDSLSRETLEVFRETDTHNFLAPLVISSVAPPMSGIRNVFRVVLRGESAFMRFVFRVREIQVDVFSNNPNAPPQVMSLHEYTLANQIQFLGYDVKSETATAFVRAPLIIVE